METTNTRHGARGLAIRHFEINFYYFPFPIRLYVASTYQASQARQARGQSSAQTISEGPEAKTEPPGAKTPETKANPETCSASSQGSVQGPAKAPHCC